MYWFMGVIAVGHDIVEVKRIQDAHRRYGEKFLERVYSAEEIDYCLSQKNPYPSLAVRFAAKEAVAKALGTGIGAQLTWRSIVTVHTATGKPEIKVDALGRKLMEVLGAKKILASLTHTREIASAVVVLS